MKCMTYTVPEAARIAGVSRSEGYEAVKRNDWPHRRIGHRIVILKQPFHRLFEIEDGDIEVEAS